ncbi:minichromosome maintenance- protein [Nowakowskiella sp. JEL0407]|nr:minichromosome maintenance- protein [Nowakowskiella sp. JEL0407]
MESDDDLLDGLLDDDVLYGIDIGLQPIDAVNLNYNSTPVNNSAPLNDEQIEDLRKKISELEERVRLRKKIQSLETELYKFTTNHSSQSDVSWTSTPRRQQEQQVKTPAVSKPTERKPDQKLQGVLNVLKRENNVSAPNWNVKSSNSNKRGLLDDETVKNDVVIDDSDPEIYEKFSKLRLRDRKISTTHFSTLLQSRKFIPLASIQPSLKDGDIAGDWVTIGVVSEKSLPRASVKGEKYITMRVTDLKGMSMAVILFGRCFDVHWMEVVGSVVAVLNPRVKMGTEKYDTVALSLDNAEKFMKLGMSLDMEICRGDRRDGQECKKAVDGDAILHIGNPSDKANAIKKERLRSGDGTYNFENGVLLSSSEELKQASNSLEKIKGGESKQVEEELLRTMLNGNNSAGAKYLRQFRKYSEDSEASDSKNNNFSIFSNSQVQKMSGFDPVLNKTVMMTSLNDSQTPTRIDGTGKQEKSEKNRPSASARMLRILNDKREEDLELEIEY